MNILSEKLNERVNLLRQNKLLEHASLEAIENIAQVMTEQHYKPGESIINQGQPGNSLYFITKGTVLVWQKRGDLEELVSERHAGEFIGELALLTNNLRNATCAALNQVEVLTLARADFVQFLEPYFRQQAEADRRQSNLLSLQQLPAFCELNRVYLAHLAQLGQRRVYSSGEIVLSTSRPPNPNVFLVLLSGQVRLFASNFKCERLRTKGFFFATGTYEFSLPTGVTLVAGPGNLEVLEIVCDATFESLLSNPALQRWLQKALRRFELD